MAVLGYRIQEGVRRCVAAREAGKADIAAVIEVLGQPDRLVRLPLVELYATKSEVPRNARYVRDTEYPTLVLGTEPPPISVVPVQSAAHLRRLTPVLSVRLV